MSHPRERTPGGESVLRSIAKQKLLGHSPEMVKILDLITRVARSDASVLIQGESGTGKELVAKELHAQSPRREGPFIAINAAAIPETLIESELFGYEKGAFTGADARKLGCFEAAHTGTLFLDEIGDVSPGMQMKLLRVLQEKRFCPVGATREVEVDVRVVTATHRGLEERVRSGLFREDLFYRLNILPIHLPPLRNRLQDLEPLANHFVRKFNGEYGRTILGLSEAALEACLQHPWPGNIRELENAIERAFIVEASDWIQPESLPDSITNAVRPGLRIQMMDFQASKEAFERTFLIRALRKFNGRINQTALQANIPKKTLLRKLEKYQINAREFWPSASMEQEESDHLGAGSALRPAVR